jgi:Predicted restriction endonuclease
MIEKNRKMIEYLANFNPYIWEQRKKARDVYANYKKNQTLLHTAMDDTDIEKLSFDIRNANNRITEKRRVIELKSRACETCGLDVIQFLAVHHRVPLSTGGSNCIDNYSILCSNCHHAVHYTKHVDYKFFDFFQSRGTLPKLIQLIEKTMNERVYRKIRMNAVEEMVPLQKIRVFYKIVENLHNKAI